MKRAKCIFLLWSGLFCSNSLFSNIASDQFLNLNNDSELYDLSPYLSFYKDFENKLTIEKILQLDKASTFFNRDNNGTNFGITHARVWGKFKWKNDSSKKNDWYFIFESERIGDELNIYVVSNGQVISNYHYDSHMPFSKRLIEHRKFIFPVSVPLTPQTIYFNVRSSDAMELISFVGTPMALSHKNYQDMLVVGIYYGIMLSMIIYNIIIFFSTKDKNYLYYIIYILAYSIIQASLDGLLHQYFFKQSYEFSRNFRTYLATIVCVFALLFATSIMQIKKFNRKLHSAYLIMIFVCILPSIVQFVFGFSAGLICLVYVLFIFCIFQISTSLFLSFKIKLARFYFIAWFVFVFGIFVHSLTYINIYIPFFQKLTYPMQWGSAIETMLLSLLLGYRINLLNKSIIEKDTELLNAKFTNLKDKMNPHFVLNTLSIIMSYLKKDVSRADAALNHFTAAYKYLLNHENKHMISLSQEIEFTKNYTNILLIKHEDTLVINYDIQGDIEKVMIPFLSLQPIVENAFKHGIRKIENGKIDILIKISNLKVYIEVRNTSNGNAIKSPFQGTLGAIRRRLQHFFSEGELTIENIENETIVRMNYRNSNFSDEKIIRSPKFDKI